jgi:uncharacterized protein (DUF433 family)
MPKSQHHDLPEAWRRRLYLPAYSVSDAARYAQVHPTTVGYWNYRGGRLGPALPGRERRVQLNYFQLVEVAFVATFRRLGVSLQRLRRAHAYLAQVFKAEYPFATYDLVTEGAHVLLNMQQVEPDKELQRLIIADRSGQVAWERAVAARYDQFDYEEDLPLVWHVRGRSSLVVIDPRVAFGAPTVKGVPTWVLRARREAGESPSEIADDFGLSKAEVRQGLRFEGVKLNKAA